MVQSGSCPDGVPLNQSPTSHSLNSSVDERAQYEKDIKNNIRSFVEQTETAVEVNMQDDILRESTFTIKGCDRSTIKPNLS